MRDNRSAWSAAKVAASYRADEGLQPGEAAALELVAGQVRDRPILDIGVGGGRTTPALRAISADYVGVDFAADMVAACRARFPGVDIRQMDARDLSVFPDRRFALALFAYNGIDYVGHADRLRILAEIHRVLADGGWLLFSSHNRAVRPLRAWHPALPRLTANPLILARRLAGWLAGIARHMARRQLEEAHPGYAIINDQGDNFRFLTYYIDIASQRAQLATAGFAVADVFDAAGRSVAPGQDASDSPWVYYLARRAGDRGE